MEWVVCSPEEYYSPRMQEFIAHECRLPRNQWIYHIIHNNLHNNDERVFLDCEHWCLCLDKHCGDDRRYLVIFKDCALKTIRDLAHAHVALLEDVRRRVCEWLCENEGGKFAMYFHFMPSVFQLHMHVRRADCCRQHLRVQPLAAVLCNLKKDPCHYQNALILTRFSKKLQRAETHRNIEINI